MCGRVYAYSLCKRFLFRIYLYSNGWDSVKFCIRNREQDCYNQSDPQPVNVWETKHNYNKIRKVTREQDYCLSVCRETTSLQTVTVVGLEAYVRQASVILVQNLIK